MVKKGDRFKGNDPLVKALVESGGLDALFESDENLGVRTTALSDGFGPIKKRRRQRKVEVVETPITEDLTEDMTEDLAEGDSTEGVA